MDESTEAFNEEVAEWVKCPECGEEENVRFTFWYPDIDITVKCEECGESLYY